MSDEHDNMVLRTLYLPQDLDRRLRQLAFSRNTSKAELIREFIGKGLDVVAQAGEQTLAEKVASRAKAKHASGTSTVKLRTKASVISPKRVSRRRAVMAEKA